MTAPASAWTLPGNPIPAAVARGRRVLLVDESTTSRELRAEIMRKVGLEVDCASDITEARAMWRPDLYSLVLMNVEDKFGSRVRFCDRLRTAKPAQQVAFLVGKPDYLSALPMASHGSAGEGTVDSALNMAAGLTDGPDSARPQRWGILEASRRIFEVRSAHLARTRAGRDRADRLASARIVQLPTKSLTLDDLVRKEMQ